MARPDRSDIKRDRRRPDLRVSALERRVELFSFIRSGTRLGLCQPDDPLGGAEELRLAGGVRQEGAQYNCWGYGVGRVRDNCSQEHDFLARNPTRQKLL